VPYAVVLQCDYGRGPVDSASYALSHEVSEAAVDPLGNAYNDIDPDHFAWSVMLGFQTEIGDMCEFFDEAMLAPEPSLGLTTQREWSNASAAAGHNPCVPAPPEPYFNVTSLAPLEDISVDASALRAALTGGGGQLQSRTKGVRLSASSDAQIELGLFSDAPTDAWQVEAFEMDPAEELTSTEPFSPTTAPSVDLQLDKSSGKNGDKITLSVHAKSRPAIGAALVVVKSTLGSTSHFTPILVGSP
jgi:hypothetical protein